MRDTPRRVLRALGLLLIVAALGTVGYALYNIIGTGLATQHSLEAADELVAHLQSPSPSDDWVLEDFDAPGYTPPPFEDGEDEQLTVPPDGPAFPEVEAQPTIDPDSTANPEDPEGTGGKLGIMGVLIFDGLGGRRVPVVQGATARDLNRGAGHHPRTSLPGRPGNCVIFGHRNTVFSGFAGLKVGQTVRFEGARNTYTYTITDLRVVKPSDPAIFAVHEDAVMSLVTCYPFHYIGHAPNRYLVTCELSQ